MPEFIITLLLGIVCIVLGTLNMKGNISTLHWYHRKRVAEENRLPFGRLVGLGNQSPLWMVCQEHQEERSQL